MIEHGISMQAEKSPYKMPRKSASLSTNEEEDAYYYVFNAENDKGFVIVSGDDRTEQVLGYSDEGSFDIENIPDNMRSWLQLYADQIKWLDENNVQIDGEAARAKAKARRIVKARHYVAEILTSRWNQGSPYNLTCPDYYKEDGTTGRPAAGCVATAIAQVVNYYKFPDALAGSIPSLTNSYTVKTSSGTTTKNVTIPIVPKGTTIDWENMRDTYSGGETEEEKLATANLTLYCGQMVKMHYASSSGAVTSRCCDGLKKYFGFDDQAYNANRGDYYLDAWIDLMYEEISTGHPLIFSGQSSGGGHAFVLDGFDGDNLFHVNWGWGGGSNGWFLVTIMNPGDNTGAGASSSSDGYSMGQYFLAGLRLPDGVAAEPQSCLNVNSVTASGMGVIVNYQNKTGKTNSFYGGMMALNNETGEVEFIATTQRTLGSMAADAAKSVTFSMRNKLTEGTYRLTPASRYARGTRWYPAFNLVDEYILAEVDANGTPSLKLIKPSQEIRLDTIIYAGNHVKGQEQEIKFVFTNLADEYYHEMHLFASKTNAKAYTDNRAPLELRAGETATISLYFTPEETGTYNIWLCNDKNGSTVIAQGQMEIVEESQAKTVKLVVGNVTIQNASNGTVYSNRLKGSMIIRNPMTENFDGNIKIRIWEQGENNSNTYYSSTTFSVALNLDPSKSVSVPFDFQNLKYDRHYYIVAYYVGQSGYLENGELWNKSHIYKPNLGILYWKSNGTLASLATKSFYSAPSTAYAVLMDKATVKTFRPNSNTNSVYVFTQTATLPNIMTSSNNVVFNGVCDTLNMVSNDYFYTPTTFTARHASFTHTFADTIDGTGWQTIALPFKPQSMKVDDEEVSLNDEAGHIWFYEFYALDGQNNVVFRPVTALSENVPYLIAADATMAGKSLVFSGDSVRIDNSESARLLVTTPLYRFYGFTLATNARGVYRLNETGTAFVYNENSATNKPFEAIFTTTLSETERPAEIPLPAVPQSTSALSPIRPDVQTTGLTPVFNLSGQKVGTSTDNLKPGIYVIQGRKILIK